MPEPVTFTRKHYKSDLRPVWCPGCGDYAVLTALHASLAELQIPPHQIATISGIGCSSRLPGYVATGRMWSVLEAGARQSGQEPEAFQQSMFSRIGAKRPGDPDEFAAVCAFLCSEQAAYVTAQNILVDGGLFPGTL